MMLTNHLQGKARTKHKGVSLGPVRTAARPPKCRVRGALLKSPGNSPRCSASGTAQRAGAAGRRSPKAVSAAHTAGRSFHFHLLRSPGTLEALGGYSTFSKQYKMKKQKITFPSRFSPLLDRADQVQGPHIRQLGIQGHSECTAPAPHLRPRPLLTRSAQTLFICFHFTLIGDHCAPSSGSVF